MLSEKIKWPSGCSCAVMISVNLDAEFFGKIWTDVVSVFCFWSTGSRNRNVDFNAGESSIHGMACTIYE